jgi:hypothetical protein
MIRDFRCKANFPLDKLVHRKTPPVFAGGVSAKDTLMQFAIFGSAQAGSERPGAAVREGSTTRAMLSRPLEAMAMPSPEYGMVATSRLLHATRLPNS